MQGKPATEVHLKRASCGPLHMRASRALQEAANRRREEWNPHQTAKKRGKAQKEWALLGSNQ